MHSSLHHRILPGGNIHFKDVIETDQLSWTKVQKTLYGVDDSQQPFTTKEWYHLVHRDDVKMVKRKVAESLKLHKDLSVEFRIVWPDKSVHWIFCRANIVYDNDGEPLEVTGINMDISDRRFKEK